MVMRATPGKWAENSAREIMAENSAIVAEYSAREKEKLWLRIQQLWPSIRQEKKIVAEYSAKLWPRFRQEKKKYG